MLSGTDPDTLRFGHAQKMPPPSVFGTNRRRRFNLATLCFNVLLPWFMFSAIYSLMSFRIHYDSSSFAWLIVLCSFGVSIVNIILGIMAKQRDLDPLWYFYSATACFAAVALGAFFGNMNFSYNMRPYYQIETLEMYPGVSPARDKGSQLMDAGRVYFTDGVGIDMKRAMGFRQSELYCVAPIVIGNEKLPSYDFWAVGTNCCSGVSSDFRCGEYNNPQARAGLRLMRDDQRQFFRLAVQQAEAAYNIKSAHPLFFEWMADPVSAVNTYQENGFKNFLLGTFAYLCFTCFSVVVVVFITANSLASVGG